MAVLVIHPVLVGCNKANDAIHGPGSLHLLAVERENIPRGVWYLDEAPGFNSPDHKGLQEESQMHANRNDKRQGKDQGPHPQSKISKIGCGGGDLRLILSQTQRLC